MKIGRLIYNLNVFIKLYLFVNLFAYSLNFVFSPRKSKGKKHLLGLALRRKTSYKAKESKTLLERQKLNKFLVLMWLDAFILL